MNTRTNPRPGARIARFWPLPIALVMVVAALTGCGNSEDAQRAADELAYHAEPAGQPAPAVTAEPAPAVGSEIAPVVTAEPAPETTPVDSPSIPEAAPVETVDYADAEGLYHQRRYNEAADSFRLYTEQHPENAWGHYMLGLSHWKAGRMMEAEDALTRVIEIDPEHGKARLNLARVLLDAGRPAEALPRAREVTVREPESAEALRVLGRAFHNLNRNEEAIEVYGRAIRTDPRDVWAMNNLGLIYIQQERFEEAVPPLARAVRLRADAAVIQNNLGVALERTGRMATAATAYRAALTADPEHSRASESLARIEGIPDTSGFDETHLAELAGRFVDELNRPREEDTGTTAALEEPRTP